MTCKLDLVIRDEQGNVYEIGEDCENLQDYDLSKSMARAFIMEQVELAVQTIKREKGIA